MNLFRQVISRRRLKNGPEVQHRLQEKFERIEQDRLAREKQQPETDVAPAVDGRQRFIVTAVVNFNIFMYAACFFIQVGTMPVR